jgi:uncharacterized protein YaaN involved in tellurite resistance
MTDTAAQAIPMDAPDQDKEEDLQVAPPAPEVTPEAAEVSGPQVTDDVKAKLKTQADEWTEHLAAYNPKSLDFEGEVDKIANAGNQYFESTANTNNRFLQGSLQSSKNGSSEAQAAVSKDLYDLRNKIEELSPKDEDFAKGFFSHLPGVNLIKRYFRKYESNAKQLNAILDGLEAGRNGLIQDNAALKVNRESLWNDILNLKKVFVLLSYVDDSLVTRIEKAKTAGDSDMADALDKQALFSIRQRRQDVITQIAVTMQSYLAMGIIRSNNEELIKGVKRAKTTTMTALTTAVVVAQALDNQKLVLDQIKGVNDTTNSLINRTSEQLKDNSARVQEDAINSGVGVDALTKAFDSVFTTLDSIDTFRSKANDTFAKTINTLSVQVDRAQPYLNRDKKIAESAQDTSSFDLDV